MTSFWYLCCKLLTYFTHCFSVFIVVFEQINTGLYITYTIAYFGKELRFLIDCLVILKLNFKIVKINESIFFIFFSVPPSWKILMLVTGRFPKTILQVHWTVPCLFEVYKQLNYQLPFLNLARRTLPIRYVGQQTLSGCRS